MKSSLNQTGKLEEVAPLDTNDLQEVLLAGVPVSSDLSDPGKEAEPVMPCSFDIPNTSDGQAATARREPGKQPTEDEDEPKISIVQCQHTVSLSPSPLSPQETQAGEPDVAALSPAPLPAETNPLWHLDGINERETGLLQVQHLHSAPLTTGSHTVPPAIADAPANAQSTEQPESPDSSCKPASTPSEPGSILQPGLTDPQSSNQAPNIPEQSIPEPGFKRTAMPAFKSTGRTPPKPNPREAPPQGGTTNNPHAKGIEDVSSQEEPAPCTSLRSRNRVHTLQTVLLASALIATTTLLLIAVFQWTRSLQSVFSPSVRQEHRLGDRQREFRSLQEAIAHYDAALFRHPNDANVLTRRGLAYYGLQQYTKAVEDYNQALRLNPRLKETKVNRAAAFFYLQKYTDAVEDYNNILADHPDDPRAHFGRALNHSKLRRYQEAIDDLLTAVSLDPHYTDAYRELGRAYDALNNPDKAIDAYTKALSLNCLSASTYFNRGTVYHKTGKFNEALSDFNNALAIDSGEPDFFNDRGYTYEQLGKRQEAITDYSSTLELDPNYTLGRANLQHALHTLIDQLRKHGSVSRADAPQYADLSFIYLWLGNSTKARRTASTAIRLDPDLARAYQVRGEAATSLKDYLGAVTDETTALKLQNTLRDAYFDRARAYLMDGRYDKASRDYDSFLSARDTAPKEAFYNHAAIACHEQALTNILLNNGAAATQDAKQYLCMNGWHCSASGSVALLAWLGCHLIHDQDRAQLLLSNALASLKSDKWPYPILKFLAHEMTDVDLLNAATNNFESSEAHTWIGFDCLNRNLADQARNHFRKAVTTGYPSSDSYLLSRFELSRLRTSNSNARM